MAIKSPQAAASNEILLGSSSAVAVKLPCIKDVADSFHDVEFVWHDDWLRWYVDGVMLLEEFKLQEREDGHGIIELSVEEDTLSVDRVELSSANASDPYSFSPRLGSVRGSLSVVEVDAFIDEVAGNFPLITRVEDLGRSVEGRPLRALCLGACDPPEGKMVPQALFTGMHHAREPISMMVQRNTSDFSVALNYHSYGKYFNLPFACQVEGQPIEPNNSVFVALAREMAHFNGFNYGQSWKDSNLYTVNGETSDWMWQVHGIFAMSPEVGPSFQVASVPGFWPSPADVPQLSSELHYSNLYLASMAGPVYSLEVKSVQLGAIDDGGSTLSFVSVEVEVSNSGLRPGTAELLGSVFVNGTSASDPVHLELKAEPLGSGSLAQSHTVMIPYSIDDFHQSMRDIKDLYLIVRDTLSCHLFRVEYADEGVDILHTSPICPDIKDVAFLESVHTRDAGAVISGIEPSEVPTLTTAANASGSSANADVTSKQQSSISSILPSVSWSGPVAMAALAGLVLLIVVMLFRRRRSSKKTRAKSASGTHKKRSNVQYSRIDANSPVKDNYDDEIDLVDAECGERGSSDDEDVVPRDRPRRTPRTQRSSSEEVV
ncbi:serine/threonine-protein kinase nek3 [Phytophthora nicotianae]|uniref:Serine/threonine-protein kinase nek3 n=1 Tax=Phytophthora nicotianae TaxID=4792 RepID=A0A0W8DBK9_PHYNI|nr:serine/threonine-protein kinase nek3 [Phytophthora nicotianae]